MNAMTSQRGGSGAGVGGLGFSAKKIVSRNKIVKGWSDRSNLLLAVCERKPVQLQAADAFGKLCN
jgi:hypothetical protein